MSDTALTPDERAKLRAKAHEVLAWNADDPRLWLSYDTLAKVCNLDGCWAELIELLDPGTVLALLDAADEVATLRAEVERLNTEMLATARYTGEYIACCEGGGPENVVGSLAMSVGRLKGCRLAADQRISTLEAENATLRTTLHNARVNPDCGTGVGDKPACGSCVWCENAKLRDRLERRTCHARGICVDCERDREVLAETAPKEPAKEPAK